MASDFLQGVQVFQQGVGQLGAGMQKYGQQKQFKGAAESIRGEDPSEFTGGEAGQEQAALLARGGNIAQAQQMRNRDGIEARMQKLIIAATQEKDPDKRADLYMAVDALGKGMKRMNMWKLAASGKGGGKGGGKVGAPTEEAVIPYVNALDGVDNAPVRSDFDSMWSSDETNDAKFKVVHDAWKKDSIQKVISNSSSYFEKRGKEYHPDTIESIVENISAQVLNTGFSENLDEFRTKDTLKSKWRGDVKGQSAGGKSKKPAMVNATVYPKSMVKGLEGNSDNKKASREKQVRNKKTGDLVTVREVDGKWIEVK